MDGITTGSTLLDALLLASIPVLTVLLQRFGLGWVFDKAKKPEPAPEPATFAKQQVAFDWLSLLLLIVPMLLEAIKAFRAQTGREPTPKEVREIIRDIQNGEQRFTLVEELPENDLEQVGGGKNRLKATLDNFDRTVTDIGSAARGINGLFKPVARM